MIYGDIFFPLMQLGIKKEIGKPLKSKYTCSELLNALMNTLPSNPINHYYYTALILKKSIKVEEYNIFRNVTKKKIIRIIVTKSFLEESIEVWSNRYHESIIFNISKTTVLIFSTTHFWIECFLDTFKIDLHGKQQRFFSTYT